MAWFGAKNTQLKRGDYRSSDISDHMTTILQCISLPASPQPAQIFQVRKVLLALRQAHYLTVVLFNGDPA